MDHDGEDERMAGMWIEGKEETMLDSLRNSLQVATLILGEGGDSSSA